MIFESIRLSNPPDFEKKEVEDIWFSILKHLSDAEFISAVNILARTSEFFPKPANILKAVPTNQLSGSQAWEKVQKEMDRCCGAPEVIPKFSDPIISAVVNSMGGINFIWEQTYDYSPIKRKFIQRYEMKVSENRLLPGSDVKELEGKECLIK